MKRYRIIHGPNLDLLGTRETGFYGHLTLEELNEAIRRYAGALGVAADFFQSNREDLLIKCIREASEQADGLIINPAGLGYSSLPLRDAVIACKIPVVEVHLSNIHARESFRQRTIISDVCCGQITGFRQYGYMAAILVLNGMASDQS